MKKIVAFATLIAALSGCATSATPSLPPPTQTPVINTSTPIPTPTLTPAPSLTPEPTSDVKYTYQCPKVESKETPLKEVTSGTILKGMELLNIRSGAKYPLSNLQAANRFHIVDPHGSQTSPDRTLFAYLETMQKSQQILWVVDARAQQRAKMSFQRTDLGTPRWLDNERLLFYTAQTEVCWWLIRLPRNRRSFPINCRSGNFQEPLQEHGNLRQSRGSWNIARILSGPSIGILVLGMRSCRRCAPKKRCGRRLWLGSVRSRSGRRMASTWR